MSNILGIDSGTPLWQRDNAPTPQQQDFAHELAKENSSSQNAASPTVAGAQNKTTAASIDETSATAKANDVGATEATVSASSVSTSAEGYTLSASANELLARVAVTPVGMTEPLQQARVFGLHAFAQAYLSELSTADPQFGAADISPRADEAESEPQDEAAGESPNASVAEEPALAETSLATPAADMAIADAPPSSSRLSTTSEDLAATAIGSGTADNWAERSLRFTRQRDGGSVAWLRDFRIGDSDVAPLISMVLSQAKSAGSALNRIMLNGREVWTSHQGTLTGDKP